MSVVDLEHLHNGFSALSVLTRQMVHDEIDRALQDTAMEYHRAHQREVQVKLAQEVAGLTILRNALRTVMQEFKEITGEDSNRVHDRNKREGVFRTSSEDGRPGIEGRDHVGRDENGPTTDSGKIPSGSEDPGNVSGNET